MTADTATVDQQLTIFLSYARADRERIALLTNTLQSAGLLVWWDALIEGGAAFAKTIESALDHANVVVVAWSKTSVASDWVRDEAAHGRDGGRFVPISLDGTPPPLGFRQYHFIDFTRWTGDAAAPEIKQLVSAIHSSNTGAPAQRIAEPAQSIRPTPLLKRRSVLAGAGVAGAVIVGGGYLAWDRLLHAAADNSIAVLPFANLSSDPSQSYFSDGLSEELRARLGQSGQFKVAAPTSSNLFRDHKSDAVTTAAKLGVAYLLDGSVRREGNAVRIVSELIDARSGLSKWSQSYDRNLTDIFALQSEIATVVMQAIAGQIAPATRAALKATPGTNNVLAYDAYLKGKEQYNLDIDENSDRKALAYFDQAIAADPNYAQAYAARSDALIEIAVTYTKNIQFKQLTNDALTSAHKAIALAPALAEAQFAAGSAIYNGQFNFRAARPFYDRAYALGHSNASILEVYAYFASKSGRNEEALAAIDKAIVLDPLNPLMFRAKGKILYSARRYSEAVPFLKQAITMNPKISNTYAFVGFAWLMQNKLNEARLAFLAERRADWRLTGLAIVDHKLGKKEAALDSIHQLVTQYGEIVSYQLAEIKAQSGEIGEAMRTLEKAFAINDPGITFMLSDPMLDPLRSQPAFSILLRKLGL